MSLISKVFLHGKLKSLIAVFSAAVFIFSSAAFSGCSDQNASGAGFSLPPIPVEIAGVNNQRVVDKYAAVGTLQASEEVTIVSEIDATVVSLPFDEGGYVKKGDLIAQLDDSQLSADEMRTEALYNQSNSSYERIKAVVENNAATKQSLDDAYAAYKVAEANYKLAKAKLSKTKILAPFDGIIGARQVSVGTFLRAGQKITELANLDQIRVSFSAPEKYLAQLKRNSTVNVTSPVYPGYSINGQIIAIEPILDPSTRNLQIVARMQNPGQKFRPGMSANVAVVLSENKNALTIPNEAVFASGDQSFVFVVKPDSTVAQTPISLGLQMADVVEVKNGLSEGMEVVRAGHQKLFNGAKVMPINSQNKSAAK